MSSLIELKQQETEILLDIMNSMEEGGEISEEDDKQLAEIELKVKEKLNAYVSVVKSGGVIEQQVAEAKKNIEELKYFIGRLEKKRNFLIGILHRHLQAPMEFVVDGALKWVKAAFSVRRTVDLSKVEDSYLHWTISTTLTPAEEDSLIFILRKAVGEGDIDPQMESKILEAMSPQCNIRNLPEGHPAVIEKERTPTLKITVSKPKEEDNNET